MIAKHTLCDLASRVRRSFGWSAMLLLPVLLLVPGAPAAAQRPAPTVAASDTLKEIRLSDGSVLVGRIISVAAGEATIVTTSGVRVVVPVAQIRSIEPVTGSVVGGDFWRSDPNRTRLFFSPTARPLAAGAGYLGVYELFIPFIAIGLTDRIILAGGSPFYLAFSGDEVPPLYLGPKVTLVNDSSMQLAVGGLAVFFPASNDFDGLGIVYGVGTFGSPDHAVSAGAGWGYVDGSFSSKPLLMLGGETRVGRSSKLITENLIVSGEDVVLVSGGVRFFGERLSADAGIFGLIGGGDGFCCLPLVNFVYNFGSGS